MYEIESMDTYNYSVRQLHFNYIKQRGKWRHEGIKLGESEPEYSLLLPAISNVLIARIHEEGFYVRFEVSKAVTIKNAIFWDVTRCGSYKNRRFVENLSPPLSVVASNRSTLLRNTTYSIYSQRASVTSYCSRCS
jgi:hypothetical protein